jgi:hypothetical protein
MMIRILALAVLLAPQDPVKFEPKAAAGEKTIVRIDSSITIEIATKDSEGEKPTREVTLDSQEEYLQEVAEADNGRAKKLKVQCTKSARNKTVGGGTPQKWTTALEGLKLVVLSGDSRTVALETGEPAPIEGEAVGAWMMFTKLLPEAEVKVGDSWIVSASKIAPALYVGFEEPAGEITVKLTSVEQGRAVFAVTGRITGETKDGYDGLLELGEALFTFSTATGKPVSFVMAGSSLQLSKRVVERRPKPGSLTETIPVEHGSVTVRSRRMAVSIRFE